MGSFPSSMQNDLGAWIAGPGRQPQDLKDKPSSTRYETPQRKDRSSADLAQMVESEIIPRLMLAHRAATLKTAEAPEPEVSLGGDTTETFARMVITKEPDSLIAFVGTLLQAGHSMEAVYVDLLAPAARRLGDYWDEDSISFTDVTIGLGRLQQVVRALGWRTPGHGEAGGLSHSALFVPGPSEQHTFGLFLIEDSFRRAGWRTWIETAATTEEMVDTVRCHWFDVFGMSASGDGQVDRITSDIESVRRASRNKDLLVLVGGRLFIERPELVSAVGANATANDGGEALLIASQNLIVEGNGVSRLASGS